MQAGEVRIFKKSGNEVVLLELVQNAKARAWVVQRTAGRSAGKQMICLERCLLTTEQFNQ
ncbi:hypothetical protein [Rheinheimera sp.]|uniref:hypothetical protein n=1 Tax=Rheinheimera sp. TaxID=1869214 RepID=UPI0040479BF9